MHMSTLKITVGELERLDEQTTDRIRAAERGAELADVQPVLNFDSYSEFHRHLNDKNLELLEAVARHDPGSIAEAAELVDRDYRRVHDGLTTLESLGILEFESEGQSKRPVFPYDRIEIDLPFSEPDEASDVDTAAP